MKLSFLTLQFCRYPLGHSFRCAAEYGFDGVEIWAGRPHAYYRDMDKAAISEILNWKNDYHLEVSMLVPEFIAYPYHLASRIPQERADTVAYACKNLETAAAIGTEKMQLTVPHPGYGRNKQEVWAQMVEGLQAICRRAEALGIHVILEALSYSEGGNLLATADDLTAAIHDVGSPALCSMIDVVPPFLANEPFSEYFDKMGSRIEYLHLCNNDAKTEVHWQLDEDGSSIPLEDFFRVMKRCGYDGWASVELLSPYFRDPELYLAGSVRVLKQIFARVGISADRL